MVKKLLLIILLSGLPSFLLFSQVKTAFSGEYSKYREELNLYMGINLNPDQKELVNSFLIKWDSSGFSNANMAKIIDLSNLLAKRKFRPVPHFTDFIKSLTEFSATKKSPDFFSSYLSGLSKMVIKPEINNENIDRFIKSISSLLRDNIMFITNALRWKIKSENLKFSYDSSLKVSLSNATITCYSQKDSTEIYKVVGVYYPEFLSFKGTSGIVTWEKAGYSRDEVYAEMSSFQINLTRNSFTSDSARLTDKRYFKDPVYGLLTDQAYYIANKERAIYPKFETYAKKFIIKNIR